jgi:hypothetical protein
MEVTNFFRNNNNDPSIRAVNITPIIIEIIRYIPMISPFRIEYLIMKYPNIQKRILVRRPEENFFVRTVSPKCQTPLRFLSMARDNGKIIQAPPSNSYKAIARIFRLISKVLNPAK